MQASTFFWIGNLIVYSNLDGIPLKNNKRRVKFP